MLASETEQCQWDKCVFVAPSWAMLVRVPEGASAGSATDGRSADMIVKAWIPELVF